MLSFFHIPIYFDEVSSVAIEVKAVFLLRQSILDQSFGQLADDAFHDLLDIDYSDIVDDPFDL